MVIAEPSVGFLYLPRITIVVGRMGIVTFRICECAYCCDRRTRKPAGKYGNDRFNACRPVAGAARRVFKLLGGELLFLVGFGFKEATLPMPVIQLAVPAPRKIVILMTIQQLITVLWLPTSLQL